MEKKPHKPAPAPMPKPIPKPPMRPCHPVQPMPPMHPHPVPYIPCDEHFIEQLYHHLKMCHKHEMEMLNMMKRYCSKRKRKTCKPPKDHWDSSRDCWDSPRYFESPCRRKNPYHYESSRHPYESSSFR